jgi:hypothetical protein
MTSKFRLDAGRLQDIDNVQLCKPLCPSRWPTATHSEGSTKDASDWWESNVHPLFSYCLPFHSLNEWCPKWILMLSNHVLIYYVVDGEEMRLIFMSAQIAHFLWRQFQEDISDTYRN